VLFLARKGSQTRCLSKPCTNVAQVVPCVACVRLSTSEIAHDNVRKELLCFRLGLPTSQLQPFLRPIVEQQQQPASVLHKGNYTRSSTCTTHQPSATGRRPLHMISLVMHIISKDCQTGSSFSFFVEGDLPSWATPEMVSQRLRTLC
jgi:hypothetical protein